MIEALREGMANPEFLEFGVITEGLVINVPSPNLVVPPSANMFYMQRAKSSWLRITIESKGCRK